MEHSVYQLWSNSYPKQRRKNMLNVGKRINMCGDYSVGFVDFSK